MKKRFLTAAAIIISAIIFTGCGGSATISMTTDASEVKIEMAGTGEAVIDWGDGFAPETVKLSPFYEELTDFHLYTHTFSRAGNSHTITIRGQNITLLFCNELQLTDLKVKKNTALTYLSCYDNRLTTLDVTKNTALTYLYCGGNPLTVLDVTSNTELEYLYCYGNQLTSLDVTKNTALKYLYCNSNWLTTLDVAKNTELEYLYCSGNPITSLDMGNNTALTEFTCSSNQLTVEGLNALLSTLHNNVGNKTIYFGNNPGTNDCNRTIATDKGWTVYLR